MTDDTQAIVVTKNEAKHIEYTLKQKLAELHATPDHLRVGENGRMHTHTRDDFHAAARLLRRILKAHGHIYKPLLDINPPGTDEDLGEVLGIDGNHGLGGSFAERTGQVEA